jgi:hypothetical protein
MDNGKSYHPRDTDSYNRTIPGAVDDVGVRQVHLFECRHLPAERQR